MASWLDLLNALRASLTGATSNSSGRAISGGNTIQRRTNTSNYALVNGSAFVDSISNSGSYVTIRSGAGNDTISNSGSNVVYQYNPSTDGEDVIIGYNSTDTIQVPNSIKSYSTSIDGNDKIIKLGGGSIRLKNAAYKSLKVYAGYVPSGGTTTSSGGTSYSGGSSNGGTSYSGSTSNGGTSYSGGSSYNSNSQSNSKSSTKVTGSSSADYISNYGNYVTICGGAGADTINNSGSNVVYQYNPSTDGQDVIIGYNSTDKIQVPNSYTSFSTLNSGNDKIIKIGEGSIRLKDAAYKSVAVYAGYVPNGSSTTSSGGTSYGGGTSYSGGTSNGGTSYSGGTSNGGTGYSGGTSNGGTSYSGGSSSTTGGGSSYNSVMTRTVTNTDASRITVPKDYQIINASSRTQPIHIETKAADSTIYGGSGDDTLIGRHSVIHGYGGNDSLHGLSGSSILYGDDGNDTLAAASNDSLYGGAGSDVFRYTIGDGKVYIMDYTAQDYIKVTGKYSTLVSGNDAIIRVGSGSSNYITVKNAAHTPLNIIRNSSNYMEEPWFMEDDGDFASSSDMDSILKTSDYSQSTSDSFKNDLTSSLNVSSDALLTSNKLDKSNK